MLVRIFSIFLTFLLCSCEDRPVSYNEFLRIGISPDYPPFEFIEDGTIVGIGADIIREVSNKLNRDVIFVRIPFEKILQAVSEQKVDMAISSISYSEQRANIVDFSDIYYTTSFAILFRKGAISGDSITDLDGKTIGVQSGSVMESFLSTTTDIKNAQIVKMSNSKDLLKLLMYRKISTMLVELEKAVVMKEANPSLDYMLIPTSAKQGFAIALPKGSNFLHKVNDILREMEQKYTIEEIRKKWIGEKYIPLYNFNHMFDIRGSFIEDN